MKVASFLNKSFIVASQDPFWNNCCRSSNICRELSYGFLCQADHKTLMSYYDLSREAEVDLLHNPRCSTLQKTPLCNFCPVDPLSNRPVILLRTSYFVANLSVIGKSHLGHNHLEFIPKPLWLYSIAILNLFQNLHVLFRSNMSHFLLLILNIFLRKYRQDSKVFFHISSRDSCKHPDIWFITISYSMWH